MHDTFRLRKFRSCPASLLWGCSSGRLKARGVHDALGTALYYLIAGAPFVMGNLWDVTDKDIDKLCMAHMQRTFPTVEGGPVSPTITAGGDAGDKAGAKGKSGSSSKVGAVRGKPAARSVPAVTLAIDTSSDHSVGSNIEGSTHAAQALAQCRDVCRMPFAVGAAPVVYGIPALLVERHL
jgi:separase